MASRILLAAILASGALGRAIPEGRDVVTVEERGFALVGSPNL